MTTKPLDLVRAVRTSDSDHRPAIAPDGPKAERMMTCKCDDNNKTYTVPAYLAHADAVAAEAVAELLKDHDAEVLNSAKSRVILDDEVWECDDPRGKKLVGLAVNRALALVLDGDQS